MQPMEDHERDENGICEHAKPNRAFPYGGGCCQSCDEMMVLKDMKAYGDEMKHVIPKIIRSKAYSEERQKVVFNDSPTIYNFVHEAFTERLEPESIPFKLVVWAEKPLAKVGAAGNSAADSGPPDEFWTIPGERDLIDAALQGESNDSLEKPTDAMKHIADLTLMTLSDSWRKLPEEVRLHGGRDWLEFDAARFIDPNRIKHRRELLKKMEEFTDLYFMGIRDGYIQCMRDHGN